jgi:O-antigen ligase
LEKVFTHSLPVGRVAAVPAVNEDRFGQAALILLGLTAVSVLFSIAVSQILLSFSLLAFLLSRRRLEAPPLWPPLALYLGWTLVSLTLAAPLLRGLPQVKKFYIFLILVLGCALIRRAAHSAIVVKTMFVVASLAALVSIPEFVQTYVRLRSEGHDFYLAYTLSRTTGFMGHWMTFSGQLMLVLMMLLAWVASQRRPTRWERILGWSALALIAMALMLAFTRGVWLGCLAGTVYVLWQQRRRWLIALPVAAVVCYLVAPGWVQTRARSILSFENDNTAQARLFMWRTGLAMVQDRPVLGVGPDGVKYEFNNYRPDAYMPPAWYGHLHNDFLQIAAERGLPGLAAFLWLVGAALVAQIRLARGSRGSPFSYLAQGAAAATIALAVAGCFEYNFGDSEVAMLWLALLSCGYALRHEQPAGIQPKEVREPETVAVA